MDYKWFFIGVLAGFFGPMLWSILTGLFAKKA